MDVHAQGAAEALVKQAVHRGQAPTAVGADAARGGDVELVTRTGLDHSTNVAIVDGLAVADEQDGAPC